MKKKSTLIVSELSDMLTAGDAKALLNFCDLEHSVGVAELISALSGNADRALIGHAGISSPMPGALPKDPAHSNHFDLSRWHNPAPRRITL